MKNFLKSIGSLVLGSIFLFALIALFFLFLYGSAWLSMKVLPVMYMILAVTFLILLAIILPLSFFKKCRVWCSVVFLYWSYFCGLSLWMWSLLVTVNLWGFVAAIIGLVFAGVGIFPVALLACIFKGEWSIRTERRYCQNFVRRKWSKFSLPFHKPLILNGAPARTRTVNQLIKSQLLYR
jgi:hypothetical protein